MSSRFKGSYASYVIMFFFHWFCMAAFGSVISVYLTGIGVGYIALSRIASAPNFFAFLVIPITGYLCDRTGKTRQICGVLMIAIGVMAVLFALSHAVWALFVLNGLVMSLISAVQPSCERIAGSSKYRYGVLRVWGTIGYAVGAQAAGLAIDHLPPMALFIAVLISGIASAIGFLGADDPILPDFSQSEPTSKARLSSFLSNPHYLLFLLVTVLFWGCSGSNMTYVPILLQERGVSTSLIGTVIFLSTLAEIPLILFSNRFMDRLSGKTLIFIACGLTLLEFLIFGLISSAWTVVCTVILLKAIATTTFVMITLKVVRNLVAPELTSTGLSIASTCNGLGMILMQNAGGFLLDRYSVQTLYLVMAGVIGITMILALPLKVRNDATIFS